MSFYCTLSSATPNDKYSNNTGGRFWADLPRGLFLDNRWKVSLVELIYKRDWPTIRAGENAILVDYYAGGELQREIVYIPPGHYNKNAALIYAIQQLTISGLDFQLIESNVVELSYSPQVRWQRIGISISLAEILGFTQNQEASRDAFFSYFKKGKDSAPELEMWSEYRVTAKRPIELSRDLETLMVRCNIIEPQMVGNRLLPVLRTIPVKGRSGETVSVDYAKPHYVRLSVCVFQSIFIEIFPTYSEQPIPFESGVILKLHFKKDGEE